MLASVNQRSTLFPPTRHKTRKKVQHAIGNLSTEISTMGNSTTKKLFEVYLDLKTSHNALLALRINPTAVHTVRCKAVGEDDLEPIPLY